MLSKPYLFYASVQFLQNRHSYQTRAVKSLFDILVDSVVCVEKTANQKPMNIAVNQ